jgi:hypothetical protein
MYGLNLKHLWPFNLVLERTPRGIVGLVPFLVLEIGAQFHVRSKYLDLEPPTPTLQFGYPPNIYLCPSSTWMSEVANVYFNNMHCVGRFEVFS